MNIFKWMLDKGREKPNVTKEFMASKELLLKTSSLREIMNKTKDIPISEGGLYILIEKICYDIEQLQNKIEK